MGRIKWGRGWENREEERITNTTDCLKYHMKK